MTVVVKRNPGLSHQGCGGTITRVTHRAARKSAICCSRCYAEAEFDPIYERLFDFILEDGEQRKIPIRRYRNRPVKGRIVLTAH